VLRRKQPKLFFNIDHYMGIPGAKATGRGGSERDPLRRQIVLLWSGWLRVAPGVRVVAATTDRRSGVRRIARIDLWEVSLVTFPMLPGARLAPADRHGSAVPSAWTPALTRATAALATGATR
jgi:hypothetical protein